MKTIACLILSLVILSTSHAFAPRLSVAVQRCSTGRTLLWEGEEETKDSATKESLEEKMKKWEATEEEQKAASLGGVVPGRADSFDLVLYILFPFMVLSGLAFAFFPLIMDKIDVDSVGPPPTF